jgi:tetratricopeptide (TPR) repeat protein
MKDEASALFKEGKVDQAIEKFKECLTIDPLNIHYNATIYLNVAIGKVIFKLTTNIGLNKLKKNEEALSYLNKAI